MFKVEDIRGYPKLFWDSKKNTMTFIEKPISLAWCTRPSQEKQNTVKWFTMDGSYEPIFCQEL